MEASTEQQRGRVVKAGDSYQGKQGPNYTPGISAATVGSRALWLGSAILPPRGGSADAAGVLNRRVGGVDLLPAIVRDLGCALICWRMLRS